MGCLREQWIWLFLGLGRWFAMMGSVSRLTSHTERVMTAFLRLISTIYTCALELNILIIRHKLPEKHIFIPTATSITSVLFQVTPRATLKLKMPGWRCRGCSTVNGPTINNCVGCGYHKTQQFVKMIFCGECGDGPYLAANNTACMNIHCLHSFGSNCQIQWHARN